MPFFLGTCDVATYAAQRKHTSCEMAARELRYAQLEALCPPGSKIATAHTASDNTETVLERLTRGTGLAGLCGIPPVRGRIIRPLLYVTRPQILGFLAQQHQSYVTDSTNAQDAFFRNRLRHHVLPVLRQPEGVWGCVLVVIVSTALPYYFYTKGLEGVESGKASIITNIEPMMETLMGVVVFHEALTVWTVAGIVCVLGAVALLAGGKEADGAKQRA